MSEDQNNGQKYGIYIPQLNIFVYVNSSKEEFLKILSDAELPYEGKKMTDDPVRAKGRGSFFEDGGITNKIQEHFDDFEKVVQQVSKTPYDKFCSQLHQFDYLAFKNVIMTFLY